MLTHRLTKAAPGFESMVLSDAINLGDLESKMLQLFGLV